MPGAAVSSHNREAFLRGTAGEGFSYFYIVSIGERSIGQYRRKSMYELIIVWITGEKETFLYDSDIEAEAAGRGMRKAFGGQISWLGVNRKR